MDSPAKLIPFPASGSRPLDGRADDDLMRLASAGRPEAFEVLVRRHAAGLVGYCSRCTGSVEVGTEIAQEVWASAYAHRGTYRAEGKLRHWLLTLATHRVRNVRRGARREALALQEATRAPVRDLRDSSPGELDALLARERARRVDRALAHLPERLRISLVLRFTEDLSYDEIAAITNTNVSTARSRVFHGLRELRRRLGGAP